MSRTSSLDSEAFLSDRLGACNSDQQDLQPSAQWQGNRGLRILVTDNVVLNGGDAAIMLATKAALEAAFGAGTQVRACFCGPTSDAGLYAKLYPELEFIRTIWHAEYDWSVSRWNAFARIVRRTVARRFVWQARLHQRGSAQRVLLPHEYAVFKEFVDSDLIVVSGGACLSTSWTPPFMRPLRIAEYDAALVLKKPLIFYAQSLGPFTDDDPLPDMLRPIMEKASLILCRDADALQTVRSRIKVTQDAVHLTIDQAVSIVPRQPTRDYPRKQSRLRVGICLHRWHWLGKADGKAEQEMFEARMSEVCELLLKRPDLEILFLTTHQNVHEDIQDDEAVSESLFAEIPEPLKGRAHVVRGFIHPAEFAWVMGECNAVLSSRLHGGILSMVGGAPLVALAYEPKHVGFMQQLGLEDSVLSMEHSTAEEIVHALDTILADPQTWRARTRAGIEHARSIADRNVELVVEVANRALALQDER